MHINVGLAVRQADNVLTGSTVPIAHLHGNRYGTMGDLSLKEHPVSCRQLSRTERTQKHENHPSVSGGSFADATQQCLHLGAVLLCDALKSQPVHYW